MVLGYDCIFPGVIRQEKICVKAVPVGAGAVFALTNKWIWHIICLTREPKATTRVITAQSIITNWNKSGYVTIAPAPFQSMSSG